MDTPNSGDRAAWPILIALVVLVLLAGACAGGSDGDLSAPSTPGEDATTPTPRSALTHDQCVPYDAAELTVETADEVWYVVFQDDRLTGHRTEADAEAMRSVAEHYSQQCFIGRGNDRENRRDYVVEYWRGESAVAEGEVPAIGCLDYDSETLEIQDRAEIGFVLTDGQINMHLLDTASDAEEALALARANSRLCLVGGDTDLIHTYWL